MSKIKVILSQMLILLVFSVELFPQQLQRPKLVVGIVIDQMRYDYLYRFEPYFGKDGFNRLKYEGSNFTFGHYNYVPTYTAPGHTSIYTGTSPYYHGIIANDIYDRSLKKMVYCVSDTTVSSVGSNDAEGQMSPRRELSTTITDQLKLATNGKSKVISLSLKDRAAILPGGHWPDGAYWYDYKTGDFISSTYYMKSLPAWVKDFNKRKFADKYLAGEWTLSRPEENYSSLGPDESAYEKDVFSEGKTSFPHSFGKVKSDSKYGVLESTPGGNQIVEELAKAALVAENLGKGKETDFLAISFSSTDYVGHSYGNYSHELQDMYIKLDEQIADLMKALDKQVGKGNYVLFLTADHAGLDTPHFLKDHNLPTGELGSRAFGDSLKAFAARNYGSAKVVENVSNGQVFISRDEVRKANLDLHEVTRVFSDYIRRTFPQVSTLMTRGDLEKQVAERETSNLILNGFNPARSGDIAFNLQPGFLLSFLNTGTTHGAPYSYDTHVPILFYGWHIPKQTVNTPVYTVDIAATIANLLKITEPSGSMGIPLIK
ncbi:MAG: alkaline phosphatase family protein [Ignavibacteria bacterium]|jgi:predicted AlkP superfamily pyrophosphatase or phosphodiesterase|nr:alkaline phosphatase family protein [Ignavibacteria bacterium]MCU7504579.1 alkaline phosphatase family protein [Ignavibacteria bacterium]MCU7516583.1 alkaline phosphatase family protein [Ignavibacteria bacterium]